MHILALPEWSTLKTGNHSAPLTDPFDTGETLVGLPHGPSSRSISPIGRLDTASRAAFMPDTDQNGMSSSCWSTLLIVGGLPVVSPPDLGGIENSEQSM